MVIERIKGLAEKLLFVDVGNVDDNKISWRNIVRVQLPPHSRREFFFKNTLTSFWSRKFLELLEKAEDFNRCSNYG